MIERKRFIVLFLFTLLVSGILHWRIFHLELMGQHVWRQSQTQLNILHFAKDDANIFHPRTNQMDTPDQIHRMEFPLPQWIIGMADRIFGYRLFLSRLLMFVAGMLSILGIGQLAKFFFTHTNASNYAIWTFAFSPLLYYYMLNPLPDVWALCAGIWGLAFWFLWLKEKRTKQLLLSAFFLVIATLIKLPFIIYFSVFFVHAIITIRSDRRMAVTTFLTAGIFLLIPITWYAAVIPGWTNNPVTSGIMNTSAWSLSSMLNILWGNFSSTLPEILINYGSVVFFLTGIYFMIRNRAWKNKLFIYAAFTSLGVLAYFIFELHLIAVNHDYYLFPFLPFIFLIVVYGIIQMTTTGASRIFALVILAVLPLTAYLRMNSRWDPEKPGFNKDLLHYSSDLKKCIPENDPILTIGDPSGHIWFYYLDRKGWNYNVENLNTDYVNDRIRNGVKWIVTDSEKADSLLHAHHVPIVEKCTSGSFRVLQVILPEGH